MPQRDALLKAIDQGVDHIDCEGWAEGDECVCPAHVWLAELRDLAGELPPDPVSDPAPEPPIDPRPLYLDPMCWDDQRRYRSPRTCTAIWADKAYNVAAGDLLQLAENGVVSVNGLKVIGKDPPPLLPCPHAPQCRGICSQTLYGAT